MNTTEQLKRIIRNCGMTRYQLAQRSGVAQAVLSNFMTGKRGMTTDTLDKLTPVLGLKMSAHPKSPRKGK
jgi:transcriptional regulator with XRE-family HTH domain